MIGTRITKLRESAGISQAELARRLGISRSSVNSWESGLAAPTAQYIVAMAKLFHSSADYILELDKKEVIDLTGYSKEQVKLMHELLKYFDKK